MRNILMLLPFCLLWATVNAFAQESGQEKVDDNFENVKLSEFFLRLEKKTPYKFYYDAVQLDSFTLQLKVQALPLSEVLQQAFKGTDIRYSVDSSNKKIYITRRLSIAMDLPKDFFTGNNNPVAKGNPGAPVTDYGIEARKINRANTDKLVEIGARADQRPGPVTLTGYIRNSKTGDPVTNATISVDSVYGATTDMDGHYAFSLASGTHLVNISMIGMKESRIQLRIYTKGKLDVEMDEEVSTLKEVVVSSSRTVNVRTVQMGMQRLTIENIRRIPTIFGEADVLRAITSLPGVKTVGEASTGFNVRGGSADQNLILFNDATIFNPSHFFGLFSAFNPEVIRDIELYKSSVPARYGGRLSSVLDISAREGNKKKITGSAGIGVVTSRFNIEGPLVNNKTSFILGGRTTYANWLLNLLPNEFKNSKASFQDLNLLIDHRIDSNNHLYFTGYFSNDRFALQSDTTYGYQNKNISLRWKHNFNRKLLSNFAGGYDQYEYNVSSDKNEINAFKLGFDISQFHFKANFEYFMNTKHSFDFGVNTIRYKLHPGFYNPLGGQSAVTPDEVRAEQAQESGAYITHRFNPDSKLSVSTGLRYSFYSYLGPQEFRQYVPGEPYTPDNLVSATQYDKGKWIKTYGGPEFRISVRYAFSNLISLKAAYNSLRQYIHLLSNTTIIAPTDIWKLSDPNIRPQKGQQVSLGIYSNLKSNTIETSLEVYYKKINDYLDYKPGATLLLNHTVETEVISTRGKAYGVELLIKKPVGKLSGWISYTYSRILLQAYDTTQGALVNNGRYYPANYDKPHDVTLTANFKVNHRFSVSLNSTYSTGRPITLPIGRYFYAGSQRVLYSDRNAYRIPDYFRTDFAMNIDGNHKVHQKTHNSWTIGLYNMLGRKNPYSVYFVSENGVVNGYKFSIFGSIIPFVNFNINF